MASELALANIGIAITRPVNQATKLTRLIQEAGGSTIPFPLIKIVALDDYSELQNTIANISNVDWLLFISTNAVQNGMPHLVEQGLPDTIRFAAIGPNTAEALGNFGIKEVLIPSSHQADGDTNKVRFDSESLLLLPEMHDMHGKKVMIVRGIGGREVLANTLKSRGAEVAFAECYRRINPQTNCDILVEAYANQRLQSIIITSSEAMRHLLYLADQADWLNNITICVNHARIAEQVEHMGLNVVVADSPGDEAMVQLLINSKSLKKQYFRK